MGDYVGLVGALVQPAKEGGGLFGHEQVAVADSFVQQAAHGLQAVHVAYVPTGVLPDVSFHRVGGFYVARPSGGRKQQDSHNVAPLGN